MTRVDRRDQRISSIHRYDRHVALVPYHSIITSLYLFVTSYPTLYICFNTSRNVQYTYQSGKRRLNITGLQIVLPSNSQRGLEELSTSIKQLKWQKLEEVVL